MKLSEFRKLTDLVSPDTFYFQLFFQGEPFLNKEIFEMFDYARRKKVYTAVSTNGTLLKNNIDKIISHPPDKIIISVDGLDERSYSNYRIGGSFKNVVEGMKLLADKRNSVGAQKPFIEFQIIAMKQNEHFLKQAESFALKNGADKCVIKTMQLKDIISALKFLPDTEMYRRYKIEGDKLLIKNKLKNRCFSLWRSSVITWDGKVVPCCFDKDAEHKTGELNGKDFYQVWTSAEYNAFRLRLLKNRKEINICRNCTEGMKVNYK
jgi:radical SAM protein with 4Fe4S-binding SPASM domain